jgi:hypothetical protein
MAPLSGYSHFAGIKEVGMNTPSDTAPQQPEPEQPDGTGRGDRDATLAPSAPAEPILPAQSREDTDVGWGDYGERDDNERLLSDRPPHWDNG